MSPRNGPVTLRNTAGPITEPEKLGSVDAVLLIHDQHFDTLDRSGRAFLSQARNVFTTPGAAKRLGGNTQGLATWESARIQSLNSTVALTITATPARHGPPGIESVSGEVTGFVVQPDNSPNSAIYVTGDTVWFEGVAEVARRFAVSAILLFAGAARIPVRGRDPLTMDHNDSITTAHAFPTARVFPVHHQGWEHFSESQQRLIDAFNSLGMMDRLNPLYPGETATL